MKREENLTRMNAKARIFVQISQETEFHPKAKTGATISIFFPLACPESIKNQALVPPTGHLQNWRTDSRTPFASLSEIKFRGEKLVISQ